MHPNDGRVISNFIVQAIKGDPITIYGDGSQTRSFCYVSDMIDAFIELMATPEGVTGPMNLGNPTEYSILELAQTILDMTRSQSGIVYKPLPEDDPVQRQPDISLAKNALGWQPVTNLEKGLLKTIRYFQNGHLSPVASNAG